MQMRVINLFLCSNNTLEIKILHRPTGKSLEIHTLGQTASPEGALTTRPVRCLRTWLPSAQGTEQRRGRGRCCWFTGTQGLHESVLDIRPSETGGTRRPQPHSNYSRHAIPFDAIRDHVLSGNRGRGRWTVALSQPLTDDIYPHFICTPIYGKGGFSPFRGNRKGKNVTKGGASG